MQRAGWSPVTHPFATLMESKLSNPVRLACVKHAASVRPEPESNSPLKKLFSGALGSNEIVSLGAQSPPAQKPGSAPRAGPCKLGCKAAPGVCTPGAAARSTLLSSQPANCAEASSASDLSMVRTVQEGGQGGRRVGKIIQCLRLWRA